MRSDGPPGWDYDAVAAWTRRRNLDPGVVESGAGELCLDHCVGVLHVVTSVSDRDVTTRRVAVSWPDDDPPPSSIPVHSKWYGCTSDHREEYRMIEQQDGNP